MNELQSAVAAAYEWRPVQPANQPDVTSRSQALPGARLAVYSELASVEALWREFEPHAACTVFQNFDYLAAWQKHIGSRERVTPAVVVVESAGSTQAIFPFAIHDRGSRRLTWLAQDLCDYLAPLISSQFARINAEKFGVLWREILALLQSDRLFRHAWIELRKMPALVDTLPNPLAALPCIHHPSPGHVATLASDWDNYYHAHRSAKARKQDRSKLARLSELGQVRLYEPQPTADVVCTVETLFAQKTDILQRKGMPDLFERPGHREFFLEIAQHPLLRNITHVSALSVGTAVAAINLGMEYKGRYSLFLVSYDRNLSRYSPGVIHLNKLLQRAIDRNLSEFDFLVGEQRLKLEWSDRTIELSDHIAATTIRGVVPAILTRWFTRAKRVVKQTPRLWTAFQSLRALLGSVRRGRHD